MALRQQSLAISRLHAMSDHELKDIGIVRSQIEFAAGIERERDRAFSRYN
jgi:uncharacterized protein YjiS (DUF1127 family)